MILKNLSQRITNSWSFLLLFTLIFYTNCSNSKYRNVDEAIAKYDFEEVRKIASDLDDSYFYADSDKAKAMYQIINAEVDFAIQNKNFDRALQTANELFSLSTRNHWGPEPRSDFDDIVMKILVLHLKNGNKDEAKKYILEFKNEKTKEKATKLYNDYLKMK